MAKEQKNKPVSRASLIENGADVALADESTADNGAELDAAPAVEPRLYKGTQEIDHDLYKLEVAFMKKNQSYTDRPDIEKVEHVHFFHSVDSSGKKQATSTAVGGHHHTIEIVQVPGGRPRIKVGPPRKWVMKKIKGKLTKVEQPVYLTKEMDEVDEHTHEITYRHSEKIIMRQLNADAGKITSAMDAKRNPPKPEGVL